jgi:hypothetical protein
MLLKKHFVDVTFIVSKKAVNPPKHGWATSNQLKALGSKIDT